MTTATEPTFESPSISDLPCATSLPSIYASFKLGDSEFALPVNQIQEVVNEPEDYSSIPLTPGYVLGLFNLRGTIVPVVDLGRIFLPERSDESRKPGKVTIIEYGDLCLGILFDATGEVFNTSLIEQCPFETTEGDLKSRVIQGVFKMEEGRRIVQILDVLELLSLKEVPNTKFSSSNKATRRTGVRRQCISFHVSDSVCALDINTVKEIYSFDEISNSALSSDLCLGAIDIRGSTVPIVDFAFLLGYSNARTTISGEKSVVVLQLDNDLFGLLVDSIDSIVNYYNDDLLPFPSLGTNKEGLFLGCLADKNGAAHIILLDQNKIFSNEDIVQITRGHSKLFQNVVTENQSENQHEHIRESLITFSLDSNYGINIRHVKEVLDTPKQLLAPPDSSPCIKGMFNLRGELITVVDSRKLCKEGETGAQPDDTKVLVYEAQGEKFGLMVDSVDSIVHYYEKQIINVPKMMRSSQASNSTDLGNAVDQALVMGNDTIGILDLEKITVSIIN